MGLGSALQAPLLVGLYPFVNVGATVLQLIGTALLAFVFGCPLIIAGRRLRRSGEISPTAA